MSRTVLAREKVPNCTTGDRYWSYCFDVLGKVDAAEINKCTSRPSPEGRYDLWQRRFRGDVES